MASKQLGKLRQWAGEVISSREKTVATDQFRELEQDIELRRDGIHRLHIASQDYHHALSKKKECEAVDEQGKFLPLDALGVVMITHGEQLGDESVLGSALVKFGRAHCKVATLQEAFALTLQDTFLTAMQRYEDEIKDYQAQRKKLESRRLSYDAAISKVERLKSSKKEKERTEAEDELEKAQSRYEETLEDVRAVMLVIQENESSQIRDVTSFLDHEMNFVEQYLEVLKDVKRNWVEVPKVSRSRIGTVRSSKAPSRGSSPTRQDSRRNSVRSHKSSTSRSSRPPSSDEEDTDAETPGPNRQTFPRRKSDADSKVPSRTPSRASRKRADSEATTEDATPDKEKEKERDKNHSKKLSVAGWVGSFTGRGKKDKDKFATLKDDDEEGTVPEDESDDGAQSEKSDFSRSSRFSSRKSSMSRHKSKSKSKSMRKSVSEPTERKAVRALYDFAASSQDELSFRTGDVIGVVSEVLDGWWMGELRGKTGLFPTTYTEPLSSSPKVAPPVPTRPQPTRKNSAPKPKRQSSDSSLSSGAYRTPRGEEEDGYGTSDMEQEALYASRPLASSHTPVYASVDQASVVSSDGGDHEESKLMGTASRREDSSSDNSNSHNNASAASMLASSVKNALLAPPILNTRVKSEPLSGSPTGKRAPPPPPPPRRTPANSVSGSETSSLSERRMSSLRSNSVTAMSESPFDSPRDTSFERPSVGGCREFKQNPFKPPGMCSNCFQMHT